MSFKKTEIMLNIISKLLPQFTRSSLSLKTKVLYTIDLNFKSNGQVLYTWDKDYNRIARFYSKLWKMECFLPLEEILPLKLKTFISTANLHEKGLVRLSIQIDDKLVSDHTFTIYKQDFEYSGWLELTYNG